MPAGEQAVDDAHAALRGDDELGPARAASTRAVGAATVSSARTTVVPTAITRPPRRAGVDQPRGRGRDAVALGVGRLAALGRGDPGVEDDRRDRDAARPPGGDERGR